MKTAPRSLKDHPTIRSRLGTVLEGVRFHDIRNSCRDIPSAVWPNCDSEAKP